MLQLNKIITIVIIIALSIAGTNTTAYFSAASEAHKKSLTTLTPESNVLKLFYFVTDAARK
jgi:predicted ribosomally synthesized peptide with SipW-like signal peptide